MPNKILERLYFKYSNLDDVKDEVLTEPSLRQL